MNLENVKPGDKLTVRWSGSFGRYLEFTFTTAVEVGKRKIKTADGREWKLSGYQWGSASYSGPYISRYKPEDDAELAAENARRKRKSLAMEIEEVKWRDLPMEILERVKAALDGRAEEKEPHE